MNRQQLLGKQESLTNTLAFCRKHPWKDHEEKSQREIEELEKDLQEVKVNLKKWNPLSTEEFKKIAHIAQILK